MSSPPAEAFPPALMLKRCSGRSRRVGHVGVFSTVGEGGKDSRAGLFPPGPVTLDGRSSEGSPIPQQVGQRTIQFPAGRLVADCRLRECFVAFAELESLKLAGFHDSGRVTLAMAGRVPGCLNTMAALAPLNAHPAPGGNDDTLLGG
jgi:hypothetical protein